MMACDDKRKKGEMTDEVDEETIEYQLKWAKCWPVIYINIDHLDMQYNIESISQKTHHFLEDG